jgi:uncharacterized protein (DUF58 family)
MKLDWLRWWGFRLNSALLHWLRARFTKAGGLALCGLAASAIWGVDTTQSMAYQSFTLFLALVLVARLAALRAPGRFSVSRSLPRFGTAGSPLVYQITVENLDGRPRDGLSVSEEFADPRPSFAEFRAQKGAVAPRPFWLDRLAGYTRWSRLLARKRPAQAREFPVPALPPRGRSEVEVELLPERRGRLSLSGVALSRPDPLGLAKAFRREPLPQSVLILPKRYAVPRLAWPGARRYQQGGVALSSSVGDSQEFMGLRDYRAGDPQRRIHWRSWAKVGKPVVREYEDEYFTRHALVLDTFARPGQERAFEEAVSVAASFAGSPLPQDSLLDLLFVGAQSYCFTAGRGLGGTDHLLELLACAQSCEDKPFSELHAGVAARHASLSGVLCVLLGYDEPRRTFVAHLRALGLPVRAFIVADGPSSIAEDGATHALEPGRIAEGLARVRP